MTQGTKKGPTNTTSKQNFFLITDVFKKGCTQRFYKQAFFLSHPKEHGSFWTTITQVVTKSGICTQQQCYVKTKTPHVFYKLTPYLPEKNKKNYKTFKKNYTPQTIFLVKDLSCVNKQKKL